MLCCPFAGYYSTGRRLTEGHSRTRVRTKGRTIVCCPRQTKAAAFCNGARFSGIGHGGRRPKPAACAATLRTPSSKKSDIRQGFTLQRSALQLGRRRLCRPRTFTEKCKVHKNHALAHEKVYTTPV